MTQKEKKTRSLILSTTSSIIFIMALGHILTACNFTEKLEQVGWEPPLSPIKNPMTQTGYKPVQMPMPTSEPSIYKANSLWKAGSRAFFRDQRAAQVGDILTVFIKIEDQAQIKNTTARKRNANENVKFDTEEGLGRWATEEVLPRSLGLSNLIGADSSGSSSGMGSIKRQEAITTKIAATILQVLPNGNLVIEGRQEMRVNFEVRELIVAGIVRPEDIAADNTIDSTKIAEARIAYGGRGQITDIQQPRYGQQVLDILLPF
ncbi:MAG: flagellar basal body L-ring protein FlgH [Alphaproteobacteria bacterium]|nr:flagellar basal body L-ring protein FlgH [Alphaproteobacteria bacterium]